jgi:hypothetical protein
MEVIDWFSLNSLRPVICNALVAVTVIEFAYVTVVLFVLFTTIALVLAVNVEAKKYTFTNPGSVTVSAAKERAAEPTKGTLTPSTVTLVIISVVSTKPYTNTTSPFEDVVNT